MVQCELDGRRIDVVGRLTEIDVIVRMYRPIVAARLTHELERAIRNHLVCIHVGGGARPALDHVHYELLVQFARQDLVACLSNGLGDLRVQRAQLGVGLGGSFLHVR